MLSAVFADQSSLRSPCFEGLQAVQHCGPSMSMRERRGLLLAQTPYSQLGEALGKEECHDNQRTRSSHAAWGNRQCESPGFGRGSPVFSKRLGAIHGCGVTYRPGRHSSRRRGNDHRARLGGSGRSEEAGTDSQVGRLRILSQNLGSDLRGHSRCGRLKA